MSSTGSSTTSTPWQDRLEILCRESKWSSPAFQIVSDRRGGRTAWSSRVIIGDQFFQARYWYDGKNVNNAKEDAAEVALLYFKKSY